VAWAPYFLPKSLLLLGKIVHRQPRGGSMVCPCVARLTRRRAGKSNEVSECTVRMARSAGKSGMILW
jgi:hypothetical protein